MRIPDLSGMSGFFAASPKFGNLMDQIHRINK